MRKSIQSAVVSVLALVSPTLYALGLGGATVESYLNQPLSIGPQYIFSLMRTRFEPESAFLIPTGKTTPFPSSAAM